MEQDMHPKKNILQHVAFATMIAFSIFSLGACSDDGTHTPPATEQDSGVDAGGGSDTNASSNNGGDTDPGGTPDGGGNNPATDAGNNGAGNPDGGTGNNDAGGEPDVIPEIDDYPCYYPSDDPECAQGPFGPGAFITDLRIVGDKTCCYDYTGNGQYDNAIGSLLQSISNFAGDVNGNIAWAISNGLLSYVFEFAHLPNPSYAPAFDLKIVLGEDAAGTFADNLVGQGSFNVLPESFEADGVTPKWAFEQARVRNGRISASGGAIDLTFPGLIDGVAISLVDVHLRATIADEAGKEPDLTAGGRVWLNNGELAGILLRDRLFESLNNAALRCDCIQDARPVMYAYDQARDRYTCELTTADASRCQSSSSECANLADRLICGFFAGYSQQVDVDSSGDGTNDGYSVGVRFEAVGASLVGMADEN
jgi:hypothetical protein